MQSQFNNTLSSNAKYLAHDYINQSYESFDFAKLVAELSQAKLQFASPAHFARLLNPSYFLDKAALNKLNETSLIMQEMLKDLFYRVGYKKDYFIKGKTKLERLQAEKELLKLSFIYVSKEISCKWRAIWKWISCMCICATSKIPSNGFLKSPILSKQSKNCKTRFKILKKTCPD
ncbi:methyltransferase regulatory domain-containing protein [Helicobacter pylori]|uniref:methyltransferase regulatory domain-containing protein n=1 Tax=Helicobacter pylori TaxID=210 RepID=UPI0039DF9D3D